MTEKLSVKESIIWAAGLFDGEGSIKLIKFYKRKWYIGYDITVTNTDLELVTAFKTIFGGQVRKYSPSKKQNKDIYVWRAGGIKDTRRVMGYLFPFLSERRQQKWADCLEMRKLYEEGAFA